MNYRHHFHAGNFADLLKHAILLDVLRVLTGTDGPLTVFDTHAGAGLYDLQAEAARKSKEADAGVGKLFTQAPGPEVFKPLIQAVKARNPEGGLRYYPGSPLIALGALRPGDRYVGCELRADDHRNLADLLAPQGHAVHADGYEALASGQGGSGRRLVLIDPPFERGDEYPRIVEAVAGDLGRGGHPAYLIWTPLKDLQTFDSFLGGLETVGLPGGLAFEARLRPLTDPLRMNGCALVLIGTGDLLEAVSASASAATDWIVSELGGAGGAARVERLA